MQFDDRLGDGYNLTQLVVDYEIFDGRGLVFEIDTIHSSTFFTADVTVTAKVDRGFAPFGSGQVYNPTTNGLIPPSSQEQSGLSPTQKARIDRHNVVSMESLLTGADSVFSITYVSDTSGLTGIQGQAFVNSTADTLGLYNGVQWVLFFGGSGGGGGTDDQVASEVPITDAGGYYTGTEVETALQEVGADMALRPTGSGAANHVAYWSGTSALAHAASQLYWNTSNNTLSIGSTGSSQALDITGALRLRPAATPNAWSGSMHYNSTLNWMKIADGTNYYPVARMSPALTSIGGFADYVPRFSSAYSMTLEKGTLRDNGTNVSLGVAPTTVDSFPLLVVRNQNASTWISVQNPSTVSTSRAGLLVNAGGSIKGTYETTYGVPQGMRINVLTNHGLQFGTNNTVRGIIEADGDWGIGTTSPSYILDISSTGGVRIPVGTTAQRPSGASGVLRYNTSNDYFEGYITTGAQFASFPWMNSALSQMTAENYVWNVDQSLTGKDDYRMLYNESSGEIEVAPSALSTHGVLYETVSTAFTPLSGTWVRYDEFLSTALENFTATDSTITYTGSELITVQVEYTGSLQLAPSSSGTYRVRLALYENTTYFSQSESDVQIVTDAAETWKIPVAGQTLMSLSTNDVISLKHIGDSSANPSLVNCYLLIKAL